MGAVLCVVLGKWSLWGDSLFKVSSRCVYIWVGWSAFSTFFNPSTNFPFPSSIMSTPSPSSPLSFSSDSDGCSDHTDGISSPNPPPQPGLPAELVGGQAAFSGQPSIGQPPSFSSALKFGVGGNSSSVVPSAESQCRPKILQGRAPGLSPLSSAGLPSEPGHPSVQPHPNPSPASSISSDELLACCLFGRIWGSPSLSLLSSTGPVMTGILLRATLIILRWVIIGSFCVFPILRIRCWCLINGPFFVNGLNLVLKPWVTFFDPFGSNIERVDQWVRIPRLP
uniref:DUF4283 domain-containing protein n=1 Tax=Opuntia streptacantha TaxID=393608 RepID=A0A7C9DW80_OPUST